ncbi:MAG: hypothetical protein WBJ82_03120 [Tepidanaerobacteraceae bacterium]|jgi:hypothetical protein|nr:hypothetical protein [Tepidanaerobacter sp.]HQA59731.1 hypothetical protein [Tepidanaerobacteraceae bacterium]HQE05540.1 hypothetical protein [Tepidanaerobacteraceae bacterium]
MAKIGDYFQSMDNDGSTMSIAYLLLMANVLGIAVYLDCKKKAKAYTREAEKDMDEETLPPGSTLIKKGKSTTQIDKQLSFDNEKVTELASDNGQNLEKKADKAKVQEKITETNQVEATAEIDNKKQIHTKDNIIDFKEAVASKGKGKKQVLEPLVWRFPGN